MFEVGRVIYRPILKLASSHAGASVGLTTITSAGDVSGLAVATVMIVVAVALSAVPVLQPPLLALSRQALSRSSPSPVAATVGGGADF
jgi:hypothetical protein